MSRLIIIRGPSGSGKSTIAQYLQRYWAINGGKEIAWCEADKYFENPDGSYNFKISRLNEAHNFCFCLAENAMLDAKAVIVSNTSMKLWEIKHYIELAQRYDYELEIIRTPGPWDPNLLYKRNKHGVPLEVLIRQINRYQPHEKEYEWKVMDIFKA